MGRPELHSGTRILDDARTLVLDRGASAATIAAIAAASSAPAGSVYHRFGSRDSLLAELWMRAALRAQAHLLTAVESADTPMDAAVAGGMSVFDFAADAGDDARLLASMRREDLIRSPLPPELDARLRDLNQPVQRVIARLAREICDTRSTAATNLIALAVIDIPHGAVRRYLIAGSSPPRTLRPHVERSIRAVLDAASSPRSQRST